MPGEEVITWSAPAERSGDGAFFNGWIQSGVALRLPLQSKNFPPHRVKSQTLMDHKQAGQLWNESAESWAKLARAGYDIYRDHLNTPAFFAMLPDVEGLVGLDIGCGEGHNTRLLAQRGARMSAIDISEVFIKHAQDTEKETPLGIDYRVASAVDLPFTENAFDFAAAFMSLMDIPETDRALAESFRVLKPGGFLQFSMTHPCFDTPHRRNLRDANHRTYAIEVGDYFKGNDGEIDEWLFKAAPAEVKQGMRKFRLPLFRHTLSYWLNLLIKTGFQLEHVEEPRPSDETVATVPGLQDAQVVSYFLHLRVRKPE
jgi:ubiquinone/menaquinone biosynthesis C-methylase UbiE